MAPMGAFALFYQSSPQGLDRTAEKATSMVCYFTHETIERLTYLKSTHEKVESAHIADSLRKR